MKIRKATLNDLSYLIDFTYEEAREAEGVTKTPDTLATGIEAALRNNELAVYWVITTAENIPVGSVSCIREWSDWHAGFYWWIQSMYLKPDVRGKGLMDRLITHVNTEMLKQGGLELRLYVHSNNLVAKRAYKKAGFKLSDYQIMTLKS